MEQKLKEKAPFWFPVAPVMVVVFIYLVLLLSGQIIKWFDLKAHLDISLFFRYIFGILLIIIGATFFIWGFASLKPAAAIGFAKRLRNAGA